MKCFPRQSRPVKRAKSTSQFALLFLLSSSVLVNYLDRGALSIAAPLLSREMSLSSIQLGLLFSAFFWSYSILQLAAGWLVDRWNVYRVFTGGFILWSLATAFTPLVRSFGALFSIRLLLGTGESVAYPCYSSMVVENFVEEKRGFANSLLDASSKLGPVLSTAVGALTVNRFGWRALFVGLACLSLLWLLPWMLWRGRAKNQDIRPHHRGIAFTEIIKRPQVWSTSAGTFALGYMWTFLLSWLPMYLMNQRGFKFQELASLGSLPFAAMAVTTLAAGWLSDRLIASGAGVTRVRKTFLCSGLALCSTTILPVPFCPRGAAITLLTISCASLGLYTSNVWAVTQTLAGPEAAGSWSGFQNAVGNLGGIISPAATGFIIHWTGTYTLAFGLSAAVLLTGILFYSLVGPIEPIRWHSPD